MKRLLMVLLILAGMSLYQSVYALPGLKFGVEGNLAMPQGDFGDVAGTGYGLTAFAMFTLMPAINLSAHAGYMIFGGKDFQTPAGNVEYDYSAIPILAGVRFYVLPMPKLYLAGQLGFHNFKVTTKSPGGGESDDSSTEFSFAPTVGVEFGPLDASAFYMIISDANYIGLRLGYGF
ncbi:MAG: outer membrane beta-barrel protein [Calditrichaceae bacterium]|nr:outer membrane beta-barrel protein [Calditrichia bacterium]NUQ44039.1 outer membrane beta-barrel protein [Calditrichaceae bacterium]